MRSTTIYADSARAEALKYNIDKRRILTAAKARQYASLAKVAVDDASREQKPPRNRQFLEDTYCSCKKRANSSKPREMVGDFTEQLASGVFGLYENIQDSKKKKRRPSNPQQQRWMSRHLSIDIHEQLNDPDSALSLNAETSSSGLPPPSYLPPHFDNLQSIDRRARLSYYKNVWNKQPAPNEQNRRTVTLVKEAMRKKMNKGGEMENHKKKVFAPNDYQIPSMKTRHELRHHVAESLKRFEMPWHGQYHDVHEEDIRYSILVKDL